MRHALLLIIRLYQKTISPNHGILAPWFMLHGVGCRFYPSCSEYFAQCLVHYGVTKSIVLFVKRIGMCHPFHKKR